MSRFPHFRRRPDQWPNAHERARVRLAERMDGPIGLAESTSLDAHLADCPACAAVAADYDAGRLALRSLRDQTPEPPRDLWARTAAAIEQTAGSRDRSTTARGAGSRRSVPVGVLSGLTVVAVVVGVSLLSGSVMFQAAGPGAAPTPPVGGGDPGAASASGAPAGGPESVEPTPFAVGAGDVAWVDAGPDGSDLHGVGINEVCPVKGAAGCPALRDATRTALALKGTPRTIVGSPTRGQAVAIAKAGDAGDEVFLVSLPDPVDETAPPAAPPSPTPESASASAPPSDAASSAPSASAAVEPSVEPSGVLLPSPEPSVAAEIAIASGIEVVGESAAFSDDGTWFAFTARPADGSGGPDVYAWRVGDERARPLTDDGASYFASWFGNELIASRPTDAQGPDADPVSVRIDPATGAETSAGDLWRPAVDPTGRLAIAWDGTLDRADDDATWAPAHGALELRSWSVDGTGTPDGSDRQRVVTDEAAGDYDVRWDETGEWVAVWVADSRDPEMGRLTLYRVDVEEGRLEVVDGAPEDVPALPGFSIGDGRLAWATPRGHDGEGSRIQIAAWASGGVGVVESGPGEDPVVIR